MKNIDFLKHCHMASLQRARSKSPLRSCLKVISSKVMLPSFGTAGFGGGHVYASVGALIQTLEDLQHVNIYTCLSPQSHFDRNNGWVH